MLTPLFLPFLLSVVVVGLPAPPSCVPFAQNSSFHRGHWSFPTDQPLEWTPAPGTPEDPDCAWPVSPTLKDIAACIPGGTLVFGGDSVIRYMVTTLGLEAWGCVDTGEMQARTKSPEAEAMCSMIFGLKERKGDGVVTTPPEWGPQYNLTLHFRYLRFGYEFLDRATAWVPDHMGDPGAADGILLGGMGYWDARYRTHDTLHNILERLGEDMAPLFTRNPTLRSKLVVLSTTYSENFDGRMGMFPHDILDGVNARSKPVWQGMGVPWFDVTRYVRAVGEGASSGDLGGRMAYHGGKLLTQDGYHPRVEVQRVILAQVFSHFCAKKKGGVGGGGGLPVGGVGGGGRSTSSSGSSSSSRGGGEGTGVAANAAMQLPVNMEKGLNHAGIIALGLLTACLCTQRGKRMRRRCCCGV